MTTSQRILNLFYCYAHQDKELRNELDVHLAGLKRQKIVKTWYDREIVPGMEWEKEIDSHLSTAHIVLLLLSPDFLNSDYCYGIEMERALKRHEEKTACVIPILARPVYWKNTPFSKLQILPTGTKPVTLWHNRDEAWWDVVEGIHRTIEEVQGWFKLEEDWLKEAAHFLELKQYEQAIAACEQTIRLNPYNVLAYANKGGALNDLGRYREALVAFEQAIHLNPNDPVVYNNKGYALIELGRYEEVLAVCDQIIRLNPYSDTPYNGKGYALNRLGRYQEALDTCQQAIHFNPQNALAYGNVGYAFNGLGRYQEALDACQQAIQFNPYNSIDYENIGYAFNGLGRYQEALDACQQAIQFNPNSAMAYDNMGYALNHLGRPEEAATAYQISRQLQGK